MHRFTLYLVISLATLSLWGETPVWPRASFSDNPLDKLHATSLILMDHSTGRILLERNSHISYPPASMTKLVTLYLTYQAINQGELDKYQAVEITPTGSSFSRPPRSSLMLLEEGQQVDLLRVMQGVAVASGNDAAHQLAELVAGDVDSFVALMNREMALLELPSMYFEDPDGWSEFNRVNTYDYARFCSIYMNQYPEALVELHSVPSMSYPEPENFPLENGRILWTRTRDNTNVLLGEVEGVDGLKTGYIDESGFNFAATAMRGDTRLISVVMGIFTDSYQQGLELRALESEALLEYGFAHWTTKPAPTREAHADIWMAREDQVPLVVAQRPLLTLTSQEEARLEVVTTIYGPFKAPLEGGTLGGIMTWYLDGQALAEEPLIVEEAVERGSLWDRTIDFFPMFFYNISH